MRALITADVQSVGEQRFPKDAALREVFSLEGLAERDFPQPSEGEPDAKYQDRLRSYLRQRAEAILSRIPEHNGEQKEKKQLEREALIFTGYLVKSDTAFMITRRSDRTVLIRLLNSRMGKLHEAARDVVLVLREWNKRVAKMSDTEKKPLLQFEIHQEIELYEHGLEEPTIIGTVINNRLKYTLTEGSRELLVGMTTALFFLVMLLVNSSLKTFHPNLYGAFERLETAFITTTFVALLDLAHSYFRLVPVIQWSVEYKRKK